VDDERIRQSMNRPFSVEQTQKWKEELSHVDIPREAAGALVLVVDDEPIIARFASGVLSLAGFTAEALTRGKAAVERRFTDRVPAVIMVNWLMPGMNGDEAIRLIREREAAEGLPRIPMVLESADILMARATGADADRYLPAPYTVREMVEAVIQAGWPRTPGSVGG
jgi:two-component system, OmpR family, phosphate regulon response regulator PhoB